MSKSSVSKKPVYGWGFESPKGKLVGDVFSNKMSAGAYVGDYGDDYKIVKVQICKYVAKKK